ncbi:methyltransferase family protein [Ferribacterium limneticum]|uniref:methyltransferase family protein n=1 Tax=Ferribacterium limneticum TaxID=76259 RepID=UPI001CF838D8|nr:isoprenylcysteine carboxylmethyltransferase family protein [Ferribacterium limneticum]UCV21424.1 isoprenylcysteine carboxylmethyltransferase family protein [Ferribacterium limneticum]
MNELIAFIAGSCVVIWLSRKALAKPGSHGFFRFFAWEAILGLIVMNHSVWGEDPYSPHQFTSWMLMLLSMFLVIAGARTLTRHGAANAKRDDGSFYEFEKTTQLVSHGIFGYIRHPMYSSLLALAWGAYFQDPSMIGAIIAGIASFSLWLTAVTDERECLAYFGESYADYMQRTKRFIPFLL